MDDNFEPSVTLARGAKIENSILPIIKPARKNFFWAIIKPAVKAFFRGL